MTSSIINTFETLAKISWLTWKQNRIIWKIERYKETQLSTHTRILLSNIIDAVNADPSPYWVESAEKRRKGYNEVLDNLPKTIEKLIDSERTNGRVTFFDALHWLSLHLDDICPFEKPKQRRAFLG